MRGFTAGRAIGLGTREWWHLSSQPQFHRQPNFRRIPESVAKDFTHIWVVDLGGDYKEPGVAGASNVFGIGTGVAIAFFIKSREKSGSFDYPIFACA